ncbi:MAG: MDR family MFS transporter [Pseudorhodoplanes sp.]
MNSPPNKTEARPDGAQPAEKRLTRREIRFVMIGLMLAMGLSSLDQTIVTPAMPTMGRLLGDVENLPWVVTAYLLTATTVTPLYGKLSDIHGRRRMLLIAVGIFILGSVACALAPTLTTLIFARGLQGLGGGGVMSLVHTIVGDLVPPRERGRYQGYFVTVFGLTAVAGPILGGLFVEHTHWSLIFWINVPLGLIAFAMTWSALKRLPRHERPHKLDVLGALVMISAAICFLLALTWGGSRYPWFSAPILALVAGSAVLWVLFGLRLATAPEPFIPLAILKNPVILSATATATAAMGCMIALTVYVPLFCEIVLRFSATYAGMALVPMMTGTVVGSLMTGQTMARLQNYTLVPLAAVAAGIVSMVYVAIWPDYSASLTTLALGIAGIGIGSVLPITIVCVQNSVQPHQFGITTGAMNFTRQLGSSVIVTLFGAIVLGGFGGKSISVETLLLPSGQDYVTVFRWVFVASAIVLAISFTALALMERKPLRNSVAAHSGDPVAPTIAGPSVKI